MIYSFEPIINRESKILLLGTMPGAKSLEKHEYYGHKNNQFWKIIFALFDHELTSDTDYEVKKRIILENRLALWDVLACCYREGSADSAIEEEIPNDFVSLFREYPNILHVFFTSRNAEMYFRRLIKDEFHGIKFHTLPSPSTAYAKINLLQKIENWKLVIDALKLSDV